MSILLSTLYNSYLPYALYGPPVLPVIVMIVTSLVLWFVNFEEDMHVVRVMELTSILGGYMMIVGQCLMAHFDGRIEYYWRKLRFISNAGNNDHVYDNISFEEHPHQT